MPYLAVERMKPWKRCQQMQRYQCACRLRWKTGTPLTALSNKHAKRPIQRRILRGHSKANWWFSHFDPLPPMILSSGALSCKSNRRKPHGFYSMFWTWTEWTGDKWQCRKILTKLFQLRTNTHRIELCRSIQFGRNMQPNHPGILAATICSRKRRNVMWLSFKVLKIDLGRMLDVRLLNALIASHWVSQFGEIMNSNLGFRRNYRLCQQLHLQ